MFFTATKAIHAQNRIDMLITDDRRMLKDAEAVKEEIVDFYKNLLGSRAPMLQGVDLNIVRGGNSLSIQAKESLIWEITNAEIEDALAGIGNDKAPGLDGFNAYFFKKSWETIKQDMYTGIYEFFNTSRMYGPVNCTAITLLPKVLMQQGSKSLDLLHVNEAQSGFIPGRHIADNILLATELIRGYSKVHMSPRCIMKVDIRKAYDSVEWAYLETLLHEFGFPNIFVGWIMECVTTVSYNMLVNGMPSHPFSSKERA